MLDAVREVPHGDLHLAVGDLVLVQVAEEVLHGPDGALSGLLNRGREGTVAPGGEKSR